MCAPSFKGGVTQVVNKKPGLIATFSHAIASFLAACGNLTGGKISQEVLSDLKEGIKAGKYGKSYIKEIRNMLPKNIKLYREQTYVPEEVRYVDYHGDRRFPKNHWERRGGYWNTKYVVLNNETGEKAKIWSWNLGSIDSIQKAIQDVSK